MVFKLDVMKRFAIYILLLIQIGTVAAQTQQFNEFGLPPPVQATEGLLQRNAMILERSGDLEGALDAYRKLREMSPDKDYYLQGEMRCLSALGRYSEAASTLEIEIKRQSHSSRNTTKIAYLLIDLGGIYLAWGKDEEAWDTWDRVMTENTANPTVYRRISAALLQNRKVDEAIDVLKRGDAIINHEILTLDLARAYTNLMDYASATEYYLRYLSGNPKNYNLVERSIYNFPNDEKTVEEVSKVLLNSNLLLAKRLVSGYLFSLGKYRESLEYLLVHDANGDDILNFARQLQNEKEYELALTAYDEVERKLTDSKYTVDIQNGMAECLQELGRVEESLRIYWSIIENYPFSHPAENALFNVGEIYLDVFNNPDSAEFYFSRIERTFPYGRFKDVSKMRLGKCAVRKGDLKLAEERFNNTLKTLTQNAPDLYSETLYELGKVQLWKENPDSAVYIWDQLVKKFPNTDISNDALSSLLLLKKSQSSPLINRYAASWLAFERKDFSSAEKGFNKIVDETTGSLIAGRSLIFLSEIYNTEGDDPIKGFTMLENYIEKNPDASIRDEILLKLADNCIDFLLDDVKAAHFYQKLIVENPDSPLAPIARKKLEKLGNDTIMDIDLGKRVFML